MGLSLSHCAQHKLVVHASGGQKSLFTLGRLGYNSASYKMVSESEASLEMQGDGWETTKILNLVGRYDDSIRKRMQAYNYALKKIEKLKLVPGENKGSLVFHKNGFRIQVEFEKDQATAEMTLILTS